MLDTKRILTLLNEEIPFIYVTIMEQHGSTPRKNSAQMFVTQNIPVDNGSKNIGVTSGISIFGTVGGGALEAEAIDFALDIFNNPKPHVLKFDLSSEDAANSDMICGGSISLYFNYIAPTKENKKLFQELDKRQEQKKKNYLLCPLKEEGNFALSVLPTMNSECFCEEIIAPRHVYIFGAGHVGRATALLASFLNFSVTLLDDRHEFLSHALLTQTLLTYPIKKELCDFEHCLEKLKIQESDALVIMTRGHIYDSIVLKQALQTSAGYIGMIGSRKKRDLIYHELEQKGITRALLNKVHCPIGLKLPVETPEEIALCIMAEILTP